MPLGELLGIELAEQREDRVVCRLVITAVHLNQGLVTHGGALFTLADTALGLLANPAGLETTWVGTSFSLQLFRGVDVGDAVSATAEFENRSRNLVACRVAISRERDDKLVGVLTNQLVRAPAVATGRLGEVTFAEGDPAEPLVVALRAACYAEVGAGVRSPWTDGQDATFAVIYVDRQPRGYAALAGGREAGEISELWIHPRWRRLGLGRALVGRARELARDAGHERVELLPERVVDRELRHHGRSFGRRPE